MPRYAAWSSTLPWLLLMCVVVRTLTFLLSSLVKVIIGGTGCYFVVYDDLDLVSQSEGSTLGPPAVNRQAAMHLILKTNVL